MEKFKEPIADEVERALRRIPTLQLRRVFYAGNRNPKWVKPLAKAGAFVGPPEPIVDNDGLIREQYWPELDYLNNMAELVPSDVVDILLTLKTSNNSWVKRSYFEIGSKIPADQAARLIPVIQNWDVKGLGWRSDPRMQVEMAVNLLSGGQHKQGRKLADMLFGPRKNNDDEYHKVTAGLEDYWYSELIPRLVDSIGENGFQDITRWLINYERYNEHLTDDFDITYVSRSVIDRPDELHETIEHALIDSLSKVLVKSVSEKPSRTVAFLMKHPVIIVRRVVLNAIMKALKQAVEKGEDTSSIILETRKIMSDPLSTDSACRVEFAELMKVVNTVSPEALNDLLPIINSGPYGSPDVYREKLKNDMEKGLSVEEKLKSRTEEWRHRLLAAIGEEILPLELRQKLEKLDKKLGTIKSPLSPMVSFGGSWVGPVSPIGKDELLAMSPDEIISHLETWKSGDGLRSPSHEGQGRELTGVISTNPLLVAGVTDLVKRLRPTYLRALAQGWEAAIKADIEPDWEQLLETARAILRHENNSPFRQEGRDFDDDPDYKQAKQAAMGLLEELARKRSKLTIPEKIMSEVADLVISTSTEESWQEYLESADDSNMDPLTASLNWRWPKHVRTIVLLLTHGRDAPWYTAALSAFESELVRSDPKGASKAVVGERLGNLSYYAPEWLAVHLDELVGTGSDISRDQQITLTTVLATSGYYDDAFDLIRAPLNWAAKHANDVIAGWEGRYEVKELIGHWVINAFIWGHIKYDDPIIQDFFEFYSPEDRGQVIGHIAWGFMQAKKADSEFVNRFGELWDLRVEYVRTHPEERAELGDFYWFVKSGKYPAEWWLPRLIDAAELHGDLNTHGMIGEIIAEASANYPRETLKALTLLLTEKPDTEMLKYDLREHAAPVVIAAGIGSQDDDLVRNATQFMHKLGSWGYIDLEEKVNKIIAEEKKNGNGGSE